MRLARSCGRSTNCRTSNAAVGSPSTAAGSPTHRLTELPALLLELAGRGDYGRRTALALAVVAVDIEYVATALSDPDLDADVVPRRAVLAAAVRLSVADRKLADAVENAPADLPQLAYRAIRRQRRSSLAEMLFPRVRARYGDRDAGALLPACGAGLVATVLDDLAGALPPLVGSVHVIPVRCSITSSEASPALPPPPHTVGQAPLWTSRLPSQGATAAGLRAGRGRARHHGPPARTGR